MHDTYPHYLALRHELSRWLQQSMQMDGPGKNRGGEDEANYALTWFAHCLVQPQKTLVQRFESLLQDLAAWVDTDCVQGYEPQAEAHHGTEPFLLFLPRYLGLFPDDPTARRLLLDAAAHIGNWSTGVPPWYDYSRDCFRSYHLGTRQVADEPCYAFELAEHFRFIHIALAAYRISGEERYLAWAQRYGRQRARRILDAGEPLPVLWDLAGNGLQPGDLVTREQQVMAASGHHVSGDPLAGIENMLASGAVQALGDLFASSGEVVFQEAARQLVQPLVSQLLDPYGDPAAAALAHYRFAFQDTSLDESIAAALLRELPPPSGPWAMVFPQHHRRREPGVGRRRDMIYWGEWQDDGSVRPTREPSTAALTLAFQLTGETRFAARALATAAAKLHMARRVLRGGREHTDMGGAICSVAAGHGRNWGCGVVTGCYGPLILGTRESQGALLPAIETPQGVPETILTLVRPLVGGGGEVMLFNGGQQQTRFAWRQAGPVPGWKANWPRKSRCV